MAAVPLVAGVVEDKGSGGVLGDGGRAVGEGGAQRSPARVGAAIVQQAGVAVPADQDPKNDRLDHVCLVIEPTDLDALAASGRFDVVGGPGRRYGARGNGTSLYVRDPDGTVVELRYY